MSRIQMFIIIGISSVLWPVIHALAFFLRFGRFNAESSALVFLPMGAIAGGFLVYWLNKAGANQQKLLTLLGYVVASPIAYIGSLGGGLFLPELIGVTLFGALPLIIGSFFGFQLGKMFAKEPAKNK